jgi:hypothetical protein
MTISTSELADEYFRQIEFYEASSHAVPGRIRVEAPSRRAARVLFEQVFFASVTPEEGHLRKFNIVFAHGGYSSLLAERSDLWDIATFEEEVPLTAGSLARLACLADSRESYLIVTQKNEDELSVVGLAFDIGTWRRQDHLLRISVLGPGSLAVGAYGNDWFHYTSGEVKRAPSPANPSLINCCAIQSIAKSSGVSEPNFFLRRLLHAIASTAHGGLVLIGPTVRDIRHIRHALRNPRSIAGDIKVLDELEIRAEQVRDFRAKTDDVDDDILIAAVEVNAEVRYERARLVSDRFTDMVKRMSLVDGAVLIDDHLQLIGFGAKATTDDNSLHVLEVTDGPHSSWQAYDLDSRGTRHRAAATFASLDERNISLLASQDGHTAAFFRCESHLCTVPIMLNASGPLP